MQQQEVTPTENGADTPELTEVLGGTQDNITPELIEARQIAGAILGAEKEYDDAVAAYDKWLREGTVRLVALFLLVGNKTSIITGVIDPATGKAMTMRKLDCLLKAGNIFNLVATHGGATAREVYNAIKAMSTAPGSFGTNEYVINDYLVNTEKPTWKGVIDAIYGKLNGKGPKQPKTLTELQESKTTTVVTWMTRNSRRFTTEQWAALSAFAPKPAADAAENQGK